MATPTRSAPAGADAIELLTADHKEVAKMHKQYEKLSEADAGALERGELARRICAALTAHATAEEEVFYPAVRKAIDDDNLMDEADIEHACAKELIAQIQSLNPADDKYDARVIVLCEYVDHHAKEEENEMFPKVRKAKGLDLDALGAELAARKAELTRDGAPPTTAKVPPARKPALQTAAARR